MPLSLSSDAKSQPGLEVARRANLPFRGGTFLSVLLALLICLPILSVLWLALSPTENIWPHLVSTVLPGYVLTTVLLMIGVAIGTVLIGVGTALIVTQFEFAG